MSSSAVPPSQMRIASITVSSDTPDATPNLIAKLKQALRTKTSACATGSQPYNMHVTITDFDDQNVAKTMLIADEISLTGRVNLTNAGTGASGGSYRVKRDFTWGGVVGAVMMANAEKSLSENFATSVCEKIFGK